MAKPFDRRSASKSAKVAIHMASRPMEPTYQLLSCGAESTLCRLWLDSGRRMARLRVMLGQLKGSETFVLYVWIWMKARECIGSTARLPASHSMNILFICTPNMQYIILPNFDPCRDPKSSSPFRHDPNSSLRHHHPSSAIWTLLTEMSTWLNGGNQTTAHLGGTERSPWMFGLRCRMYCCCDCIEQLCLERP
jgi:hypothetical protein